MIVGVRVEPTLNDWKHNKLRDAFNSYYIGPQSLLSLTLSFKTFKTHSQNHSYSIGFALSQQDLEPASFLPFRSFSFTFYQPRIQTVRDYECTDEREWEKVLQFYLFIYFLLTE